MLPEAVREALENSTHHPELLKVMEYAVFPAGKLFRPRLVEAIALDLSKSLSRDHLHLASAIELHHAYTLVHDDLPAMDNDLVRRGKPSTHAQFGEWKAILAGDGLLIASFNELSKISHPSYRELMKLMSWTTGPKGLIEGQFRDLLADGKASIAEVIRIHELKTGRLIQLAALGTYLLTESPNLRGRIEFFRLGREIGVSFQLLDDLSELTEAEVSDHEKSINPFFNSTKEALKELKLSHLRLSKITKKHNLTHLEKMLLDYFQANQQNLLKNFSVLQKNIDNNVDDLKNWITSFV